MGKLIWSEKERKEPPYLPVNFFLQGFSTVNKKAFIALMVLSGLVALYILLINLYPYFWTPAYQSLTEAYKTPLEIIRFEDPYLSLPLNFSVYRNWVSFFAGPMLAHPTPILVFVSLQLLAWSIALATATYIRSNWAYTVYFLYLIFLFLSGSNKYFLPEFSFPLIESGLSLVVLICAYLFQSFRWRGSFFLRVVVFLLIQMTLYGTLLYIGNWQAWYFTTLNQFLYLSLLSLIFLGFISKELVNFLLVLANHQAQPGRRWPVLYLRISWFVVLGLLFFLIQSFTSNSEAYKTSSSLLFCLLGIFTLATPIHSQNLFRSIQHILGSHSVLAFLLSSFGLLILSFWGMHLSHGDLLLNRTLAKLFSILLFSVSLAYIIFLESNFPDLLPQRKTIFFLIGKGRVFPFWMIFIMGGLVFAIFQGFDRWKSIRIFSHSRIVMEADASLLAQQPGAAKELYDWAITKIPASPKANYNQGALYMLDPLQTAIAIGYFRESLSLYDLPHARLNASQLLEDLKLPGSSRQILRDGQYADPLQQARIFHNLSLSFLKQGERDSAIYYLDKALQEKPNFHISESHLAKIFFENGQDSLGKIYWTQSLEGVNRNEYVGTNAMYYAILRPDLEWPKGKVPGDIFSQSLATNWVMVELNNHNFESALQLAQALEEKGDLGEMGLVRGYLELKRDSLEVGLSKLDFIAKSQAEYSRQAHYLLGLGYYEKNLLRMAHKHMSQAVLPTTPRNYSVALQVAALLGKEAQVLSMALPDSITETLKKELILLEVAGSKDTINREVASFSDREKLRLCKYASLKGNCEICKEISLSPSAHSSAQEAFFLSTISCLDREAQVERLQKQLGEVPQSPRLKGKLLENFLSLAQVDQAKQVVQSFSEEDSAQLEPWIWAQMAVAAGDTTHAIEVLKASWQKQAWDEVLGEQLVKLLMAKGANEEAQGYLSQIFSFNDQNPTFWEYYQSIMLQWGMREEATYAAERMAELKD